MNKKELLQEQSKVRSLLIQIEIALKEDRFEEALALLSGIKPEEFNSLSMEELQAVGNLINYIQALAEEKKAHLSEKIKIVQTGKEYL